MAKNVIKKLNEKHDLTNPNNWTTGGMVKVGIVALIFYWLFGQSKKWQEVDKHLKNMR
tara:strand:+ start:50 stop:223 length:174 start_codon:yes stop_codon:yes gene_type:complete